VEELIMHQPASVYRALKLQYHKKHMMSTQEKDSDYRKKEKSVLDDYVLQTSNLLHAKKGYVLADSLVQCDCNKTYRTLNVVAT
jgi:hypothetical protein